MSDVSGRRTGIQPAVSDTPTSYAREPADAHPQLDYEAYRSTRLRYPQQPLIYLPQTITEITGPHRERPGERRARPRSDPPA